MSYPARAEGLGKYGIKVNAYRGSYNNSRLCVERKFCILEYTENYKLKNKKEKEKIWIE